MPASILVSDQGPMLVPPLDEYITKSIARYGTYNAQEREAWAPYLNPDSVVYDVGANIGGHTLWFAQQCPQGLVYAFEPQRALANMLCGSVAMCGLSDRVCVTCCALGDQEGEAEFAQLDYDAANNFGGLGLGMGAGVNVPVLTMDMLGLPGPDFIKVDVEGFETQVLVGGQETIKAHKPVMSVEADREDKLQVLADTLVGLGYEGYRQTAFLGDLWPNVASHNWLCVHKESSVQRPELERVF